MPKNEENNKKGETNWENAATLFPQMQPVVRLSNVDVLGTNVKVCDN